jgi:hypothetical protein
LDTDPDHSDVEQRPQDTDKECHVGVVQLDPDLHSDIDAVDCGTDFGDKDGTLVVFGCQIEATGIDQEESIEKDLDEEEGDHVQSYA